MARVAPVLSGIVRYGGLILLVLGMVMWTGTVDILVPIHMLIGILVVLALWALAGVFLMSEKGGLPLALGAFAVGLAQALLGMTQAQILPTTGHWVIQVAHLLLGVILIGLGEMMTMRMKKARVAVAAK